jgi:uncharacterized protein YbdZ (MbtH family)
VVTIREPCNEVKLRSYPIETLESRILRDELITDQQYSLWQKRLKLVPEQWNTNNREHGDRYLAVAYLVCIHEHLLGIENQ